MIVPVRRDEPSDILNLPRATGRRALKSPRLNQSLAQQELDLPVETAEIFGCPPLEGLMDGRVKSKQERPALRHAGGFPFMIGRWPKNDTTMISSSYVTGKERM
jgi:hypothetical protein